jgi:hypothetical protein
MSPDEALEKAKKIVADNTSRGEYDPEGGHPDLDELLCAVLSSLGYGELVDFYKSQEHWYS